MTPKKEAQELYDMVYQSLENEHGGDFALTVAMAARVAFLKERGKDGLHCPGCGSRHTQACIDGGRCTFCQVMLCAILGSGS